MDTYLLDLVHHLPSGVLSNDDLCVTNPTWQAEDIFRKTGIRSRCISAEGETAMDLGAIAAGALLDKNESLRSSVRSLFFCTQTPDYFSPASACVLHHRLKLPTDCAAFDYNLGCSGFTYGLWLANGAISTGWTDKALLVAGDTLSKYCSPYDMTTVTLFGDGAAAALLGKSPEGALAKIGHTVLGTDGRGYPNLMIPAGAARAPRPANFGVYDAESGNRRCPEQVHMNGTEVFAFTLSEVPNAINSLLKKLELSATDIDLFLLHQANGFILESIRKKMKLSKEQMPIDIAETGNLSCASLPVLLSRCAGRGQIKKGSRCVLAGYGVGYSWAVTYLEWLN